MSEERERGRPTLYTPELAATICMRLVEGESLRSICEESNMPAKGTVLGWVVEDREGFSDQYAKARRVQALQWAEDILEIADEANADAVIGPDGVMVSKGELVARSRLRVDTRKWLLSKVLPKVYGEKIAVTGADGGPLQHEDVTGLTDDQLRSRATALTNRVAVVAHTNGTNGTNGKHKNGKNGSHP